MSQLVSCSLDISWSKNVVALFKVITKIIYITKNLEGTIISTGAGACLLLECEHEQDVWHHNVASK